MHYLFPHPRNYSLPASILNDVKYSDECTRLMTRPAIANIMSLWLYNSYVNINNRKPLVIVDGTANVGGNTLSFSRHFKSVVAIEINHTFYKMLQSNLELYCVNNVRAINCDFTECKVYGDIYFIDPPWYIDGKINKHYSLTGTNNDVKLSTIVSRLLSTNVSSIVGVKVRPNDSLDIKEKNRLNFKKMSLLLFHN